MGKLDFLQSSLPTAKRTGRVIGLDTDQVFSPGREEKRKAKIRSDERRTKEERRQASQLDQTLSARASLLSGRSLGVSSILGGGG